MVNFIHKGKFVKVLTSLVLFDISPPVASNLFTKIKSVKCYGVHKLSQYFMKNKI